LSELRLQRGLCLQCLPIIPWPPPPEVGIVADSNLNAQPRRARGGGVMGLFRGVENLFNASVIPRISPGREKVSDSVNAQNLPKRQCDLVSHHVKQWNV
jgi:hypothetical protein